MKPLLLLDIDGVLCPYDTEISLLPIPGHEYAQYDPRHTPWLAELSDSFDLAWASLWEGDSNLMMGPMHGLDPLPFIPFLNNFCDTIESGLWTGTGQTFKLPAVEEFIGDRAAAWVDDDLSGDAFVWAEVRTNITAPTKVINADYREGLTRQHVDDLLDWAP